MVAGGSRGSRDLTLWSIADHTSPTTMRVILRAARQAVRVAHALILPLGLGLGFGLALSLALALCGGAASGFAHNRRSAERRVVVAGGVGVLAGEVM